MIQKKSLDEIDKEAYLPFSLPMDTPFEVVTLTEPPEYHHCIGNRIQSLDGDWQLAEGGYTKDRTDFSKPWTDAITVKVPNSIHTNLFEAGLIPDPVFGKNDKLARENSYKTWWYKKDFAKNELLINPTLRFAGVCYRAQFWLNGVYLGQHGGMFGGPDIMVSDILKEQNTLIVKIENAPADPYAYSEYAEYDEGWKNGVVINCVYGWHYACIPSRGIWQSVSLESTPKTTVQKPFVVTVDAHKGVADLILFSEGQKSRGTVIVTISPKNFAGKSFGFQEQFSKGEGKQILHYRFQLETPQLWWPNGHGKQNLYNIEVSFQPENDIPTYHKSNFGLRTVEMGPLPGGPYEDKLNFTYIINGKPIFVKGTNWCTTDVLLRFPNSSYDRFLGLLQKQHVQLLRAWGGGMPESNYFYDKCDELGIMVRQEWPTCWDSDKRQPENELAETVERNLIRIRNHPSLVTLAGGNESAYAKSPAMTRMAKLCYELDGTRTFYRTSPYGGALHSYITYWDRQEIDKSLQMKAPFIGEFGMASAPNLKSVQRYLPEDEKNLWPPKEKGSFYYHMPRFNECDGYIDIDFIGKRIPEFDKGDTMQGWITASQMAQATVIRHTLESMRSNWPESVGVCYYKANDVFPACSWSVIDYYGVQKLSYYALKDSYEPLHAAVLFESIDVRSSLDAPVVLLDDAGQSVGKSAFIIVKAYDENLRLIKKESFHVSGGNDMVTRLGNFQIDGEMLVSSPLFITAELILDDQYYDRTFYWLNFKDKSGCIFNRPETILSYEVGQGTVTIINTGKLPAIGVSVENYLHDTEFEVEDSILWLDAGEKITLKVNFTDGLTIKAWNTR